MYKNLLDKINEYEYITIFHHQRPDGDCMFSSLALYHYLKDNFKDKKIKFAGFEIYDKISKFEKISDSFIKKSLAIVLDTSNINRVDDLRVKDADYIINIDHHPVVESYGDINIVDTKCAAVSELLANILFSNTFKHLYLSELVCEYLYCGILTDTICFRTTSTTYKTLAVSSKLAKLGKFNIAEKVEYLFNKEAHLFTKITNLRSYFKIDNKFGYILLEEKDLNKLELDHNEAKNQINEFSRISDINIWAFAVYNDGLYDVSVRSKRGYVINKICHDFGGGGHPNASGIRGLTKNQVKQLFHKLLEMSTTKVKM